MNTVLMETQPLARLGIISGHFRKAFEKARQFNTRSYHGGYLSIAEYNGFPLITLPFGHIPPDRIKRHIDFSVEKSLRLGEHPQHLSSAQSADPSKDHYPGAVCWGGWILSWSGFDPDVDEATVLQAHLFWGHMQENDALMIGDLWGNQVVPRMLAA